MCLDGSDDSTFQHHCVLDEPVDSLSPFTASSVVTSAVHIPATRFLNAMIENSYGVATILASSSDNVSTNASTCVGIWSNSFHRIVLRKKKKTSRPAVGPMRGSLGGMPCAAILMVWSVLVLKQ